MGNDERRNDGKSWTFYLYVFLAFLLVTVVVMLFLISQNAKDRLLLHIPLFVSPGIVFLMVIIWAGGLRERDERHKPKERVKSSTPIFGLFLVVVFYMILVIVFTPAYKAAIKLGDQLVTKEGTKVVEFYDLAYFSVVVSSTLGLGDIAPTEFSRRVYALICTQVLGFWLFFAVALSFTHRLMHRITA